MASPKNNDVFLKKRPYNNPYLSSPINNDSTQDGRKRWKRHRPISLEVAADSTALSTADEYKNSLKNSTSDTRDDSSVEKVLVSKDAIATEPPGPFLSLDDLLSGTKVRQGENQEQATLRLEKMQGAVRTLLECIGEDPSRDGLLDTPARYANALLFLTKGYQVNVNDIVNGALFHEGHNEMVIVKDIDIFSLCEHHLVPFIGKESSTFSKYMHIGYISSNTVIGLSKLPRIAEIFSRRLQIQERLTNQVAHAIMEILKPQGVAVVMESSHLCMVMRGVEKTSTKTLTSCVLGCLEGNDKRRNEFMHFVGVNR
ncbi:hypothetical protein ACHAPI_009360 [Fusarium lateritium]